MRHVAGRNGGVALPRPGYRHQCGVLEIVVVAAVEVPAAIGLHSLEAGSVEIGHLAVLIGHLGALDLQGQAFADAADDVVQ